MASNQSRPYQDEAWLREKYVENGQPAADVADTCGVTKETIFRWLGKHDIRERESRDGPDHTRCANCGDVFAHPPSRTGRKKYCSKDCKHEGQTRRVEWECNNCGKTSETRPCEEQDYCSHACWVDSTRTTVSCSECGDEFEVPEAEVDDVEYCSQECLFESRRDRVEFDCDECGTSSWSRRSNYNEDGYNFCSDECFKQTDIFTGEGSPRFNSVELECTWCGEMFYEPKHREDRAENPFCSMDCLTEWNEDRRINEDKWYGHHWSQQRLKAIWRDGGRCQACGTREEITVHHITKARRFETFEDAHELDNLVTLCRTCHGEWEGLPVRPTLFL